MKACRECKYVVKQGNKCPICGSEDLTEKFYGMVIIVDPEKSEIAKLLGIKTPGQYALMLG